MAREAVMRYRTSAFIAEVRRSAGYYWTAASVLTASWVLLILIAPAAAAADLRGVSDPVYHFFGYLCHQMPERSFYLFGHQFAVCSRCFGVYFGLAAGMVAYPLFRKLDESDPLPRFWLFLSMVPMSADWALGYFRIWENTHLTRVVTGLILGVACAVFIVPALVEIAELRLRRNGEQDKEAA
jgi:uncharacterized membrane protein